MEFVKQNKKLATSASIITIILVLIFNTLYYIFAPIQSQGDPLNFVATPMLEKANQATPSATITDLPQRSSFSLISLSIMLVIALLLVVVVFAMLKYFESQRRHRDAKRKEDLKRIAQAFEAYHQEHGQYPVSSTYLPQYYTGINLSNDWNYYGLPDKEHMVRYLPDWPLSDPSIDYHAKHQVNQYIYYPKDNGQKFYLYAHLEAPTKEEQIDYNQQDNLLRAWGSYNYRISSRQEQPSSINEIPHPQHNRDKQPEAPQTGQPTTSHQPQPDSLGGSSVARSDASTISTATQPMAQPSPPATASITPPTTINTAPATVPAPSAQVNPLPSTQPAVSPDNAAPTAPAPTNNPAPAPAPFNVSPQPQVNNTAAIQPNAMEAGAALQPEPISPVIAAMPPIDSSSNSTQANPADQEPTPTIDALSNPNT